ncbi:MAG: hypothetical protein WCJ59_00090 [bacterium]
MDQQILQKLEEQQKKIDQMYGSLEKMRKYFLWTLVITIAVIVLPLIAMIFVVPSLMSSYSSALIGI